MKRRISLLIMMLLLTVMQSCTQSRRSNSNQDGPPRLLIISSLIGYVEPCGCTVDLHLGGIDRILTAVRRERTLGPTAVVVLGPTLFEKKVAKHRQAQEKAKADLLTRSLRKIGVDAMALTPNELFYGPEFTAALMGTASSDVTVNTPNGAPRIIEIGDVKLGLLGATSAGTLLPTGQAIAPAPAVLAAVKTLRAQGAHVVVGLGTLPRAELRALSKTVPGVDLWVLGDHPQEETTAAAFADGYLVEAGDRGRNIGRVIFHDMHKPGAIKDPIGDAARKRRRLEGQLKIARIMISAGGVAVKARIKALEAELAALEAPDQTGKRFEYTLVPIRQTLVRSAPVKTWLDDYKTSLKAMNLAEAGDVKPLAEGQSGYAGLAQCADCHEDAVKFWRATKHAMAWKTLENDQKTFDAECVGCHVTGWQMPGGTVLGKVDGLTDVQCEVCHGPGQQHVESGGDPGLIQLKVAETTCTQCHNAHHSPKFEYRTYIRKVVGPGHQMK